MRNTLTSRPAAATSREPFQSPEGALQALRGDRLLRLPYFRALSFDARMVRIGAIAMVHRAFQSAIILIGYPSQITSVAC